MVDFFFLGIALAMPYLHSHNIIKKNQFFLLKKKKKIGLLEYFLVIWIRKIKYDFVKEKIKKTKSFNLLKLIYKL